jgi:iron(III) transport system ATP-binding protein
MVDGYRIESLSKRFGRGVDAVVAVDGIDLLIEPGELVVLLGPSGCGKTTALRCMAGLEPATQGRIAFGDRVVFDAGSGIDVPPDKRGVGMVFQSYALWPHKTVRQNIAYPLKVRGMGTALKEGWVEDAARLVDCQALLDRYPGQLSGGQQQRVALARGIVARPDLVLFDEPLSNLDALLRGQVRNELHDLHRRLGFAGVYVTHDQGEAFAIGDRLAIMRAGRMEQIGTPQEIYSRPRSEYAANFVGLTNRVMLVRDATGWRSTEDPEAGPLELSLTPDAGQAQVRFRPAAAVVLGGQAAEPGLRLPARVVDRVYTGGHYEVTADHGTARLNALADEPLAETLSPGDQVTVAVPWKDCCWYTDGGEWVDAVPALQTVA